MQLSLLTVPSDPLALPGAAASSSTEPATESSAGFAQLLAGAGASPAAGATPAASDGTPVPKPPIAADPTNTPVVAGIVASLLAPTMTPAMALSPATDVAIAIGGEDAVPADASGTEDDTPTVETKDTPADLLQAGDRQAAAMAALLLAPIPLPQPVTQADADLETGTSETAEASDGGSSSGGDATTNEFGQTDLSGWGRTVTRATTFVTASELRQPAVTSATADTAVTDAAPAAPNEAARDYADVAATVQRQIGGGAAYAKLTPNAVPTTAVSSPAPAQPQATPSSSPSPVVASTPAAPVVTAVSTPPVGANANAMPTMTGAATEASAASAPTPKSETNAKDSVANFAAGTRRSASGLSTTGKASVRTSLAANVEDVEKRGSGIGIASAKSAPTMSAGSPLSEFKLSDTPVVTATDSAAAVRVQTSSLPTAVEVTSSAHRAVEAVLDVTARFAARDQHSVNLQFTVGDADLKVRVQMRAGEVQTTFQTDSAELRAALSTEWQHVTAAGHGERTVRLADPVFASSGEQGEFSSSGDGASRQREQQQQSRQTGDNVSFPFASGREPTTGSSSSTTAAASVAGPRTYSGNSVHLHTLA
ncbi:hypothetical protein [Opitutus sp. ER46]|uniref:hypothetical protein n=1 Tax=Opitutus sp. ER46 TaxID=2161864 RepID=UPI000D31AFB7|nr:hypothetical protein [Opitutus sp. ER46]PTX90902.1 hypothetical protein DB354_19820 [Opitutus sp. ER46]